MDTPKADEIENKKLEVEAIAVKEDVEEQPGVVSRKPSTSIKPTIIIIVAAILGLALGIGLSDGRGPEVVISWIKLPGDLFIRALKCIVLPLVFVNIILAMVDMISAGKASSIGGITIGLYTLTTVLASIEGLIFILLFKGGFKVNIKPETTKTGLSTLQCPSSGYLSTDENSTLFCLDVNSTSADVFEVLNPNSFISTDSASSVKNDISFSATLQDGIFRKLVSDNIFNEFIIANFVGVIIFAIVFGAASQSIPRVPKTALLLIGEINRILLLIVDWIIILTPLAVLSLIAGNIGDQKSLKASFSNIGLLIASTLLAMLFHFFVVYTGLFYLLVRKNPFPYMRFLIPAQTFAFASASSAATLPLSLECVASSGEVPASVNNFALSMGATLNMDGGGIYFPTAIVFLAVSSGLGDELNAASYFLIVLLSTLGSAGTAPVPSASLVLIITAYNTVFDTTGTPEAFGLIFTIDWLMDRFRTTLNVTGDMIMARIITAVGKVPMEAA